MANSINEMMKQFGSLTGFDFIKSFEIMQAFDTAKISRQVFDFQKSAFDCTFENMMTIQEKSDQLTASFMCDNRMFPEAGVKMLEDWRDSVRKSQLEFKKNIDERYNEFMSNLMPETEAAPEAEAAAPQEPEAPPAPEAKTAAAPKPKAAAAAKSTTEEPPEAKAASEPEPKAAAAPKAAATATAAAAKSKPAKANEK